MKKFLLFAAVIMLVSCGGQEEERPVIAESHEQERDQQEYETVSFEKITLSVFCFCRGWNTKDVEIHKDGKIFYRVRDDWSVGENYAGSLDSSGMVQVNGFLRSLDFNSLKSGPYIAEDAAYHSIQFVLPEGEVVMKGNLESEESSKVYQFLKSIDTLKLQPSENRHFSTAREVPPAPPHEFRGKYYESLLDSL